MERCLLTLSWSGPLSRWTWVSRLLLTMACASAMLTGFKFIGEQIGSSATAGQADSYVFGFEESYGYLTGSYVRDKDGVDSAYMISEMFSYYATKRHQPTG